MSVDAIKTRLENPLGQATVIIVAVVVVQLMSLIIYGSTDRAGDAAWIIAGAFALFYGFFNAVFLLGAENPNSYISKSFTGYLLVLLFGAGLAYIINLQWPSQNSTSMRWIFMIVTFSYFIFITIVFFMRKIIEYAQRQDTESPN